MQHLSIEDNSEGCIYRFNSKTKKSVKIRTDNTATSLIANKKIVLAINYTDKKAVIMIDDKNEAEIDIMARRSCKNGQYIANRFIQHRGDDICIVDDIINLATIKWSDIEAGNYQVMRIIDNNVLDFSMSKGGVGVLFDDGKLKLPSGM